MAVLRAVPLLGFVLVLANVLALLGEGFDTELLKFTMTSGVAMRLDAGDVVVLAALVLLYFEVFKATRTSNASILDHIASLAVFVVALVEFLLLPRFAHGAFLALLLMALIDVIAGFTVTISSARRDFGERGPSG
jgi:steroid 5-alpha reductase family enzyme